MAILIPDQPHAAARATGCSSRHQVADPVAAALPRSLLGMWVRQPAAPKPSGPDTTARSATDRLYAGQLAPEALRWMSPADRAAAAAAAPGTTGPRGLAAGRCGLASFRPAPGFTLCG